MFYNLGARLGASLLHFVYHKIVMDNNKLFWGVHDSIFGYRFNYIVISILKLYYLIRGTLLLLVLFPFSK